MTPNPKLLLQIGPYQRVALGLMIDPHHEGFQPPLTLCGSLSRNAVLAPGDSLYITLSAEGLLHVSLAIAEESNVAQFQLNAQQAAELHREIDILQVSDASVRGKFPQLVALAAVLNPFAKE